MRNVRLCAALLCSLLVTGVSPAWADIPAVTLDNTTGLALANPPFTLGWHFLVNTPITVTQVGVFDDNQNGLVVSYPVGIWDSVGNLLGSTTVASGTSDPLINQFRYHPIAPISLSAGQTYHIGALYTTGTDPLIFPGSAINFATDPSISFLKSAFIDGSSLNDPTISTDTMPGYFGPNFTLTPVPEPSCLALLGISTLCLVGYTWRRQKQTA